MTDHISLTQPEVLCPKCGQVVMDNHDRRMTHARGVYGHEPSDDELAALATVGSSFLACPYCALAAPPLPPKKKRVKGEDLQERIDVGVIFVS